MNLLERRLQYVEAISCLLLGIACLVGYVFGVAQSSSDSGFLNRFTIGFDLEGRRMYLAPNERFGDEQPFDASGLGFHRTPSGYEVKVVLPDSPAARADLRPGDALVSIDGEPAASVTLNQLKDTLSRPGAVCDLRLMRMGKPLQVHLTLQQRL
jgi:S1-C subfamily serine protease